MEPAAALADAAAEEALAATDDVATPEAAEDVAAAAVLFTEIVVRDPVPTMEEGSEETDAVLEGTKAAVVAVVTTGRAEVELWELAELAETTLELTDVVVLTEVETATPELEIVELMVDVVAEELVEAAGQVRSKRGAEAMFEPMIPKLGLTGSG